MIGRSDKKKNIDKVVASLTKNPLQSEHEIAKNTWIGKSTVNRAKQEMGKNGGYIIKDDRIINLTDKDFELMQKIQVRKFERMDDKNKPVDDNNINQWDKEAKARYALFRWDATDKKWGLKNTTKEMSTDDLIRQLEN